MRTIQGKKVVRVSVRWRDMDHKALHFLVEGPRGGTRAGFIVSLTDLFKELSRLGVWESIGIPVREPGSNRSLTKDGMRCREDCPDCKGSGFVLPEPTGNFAHDLTAIICSRCASRKGE